MTEPARDRATSGPPADRAVAMAASGSGFRPARVNLAARIADYARPDEVLVSQEVVDAADAAPVSFVEIGPWS